MRPSKPAAEMTQAELAAYIDYSILKPEFTTADVEREIRTAVELGCKTVCINPAYIETALPLVKGTGTGICVVIDFPFGTSSTRSKVAQAKIALEHPIEDLDIVMNYGWLRGGETERVTEDLRAVVDVCHAKGVVVKVIFETDALTEDEIRAAAEASIAAGADFIKTSTGFYTSAPTHGELLDSRIAIAATGPSSPTVPWARKALPSGRSSTPCSRRIGMSVPSAVEPSAIARAAAFNHRCPGTMSMPTPKPITRQTSQVRAADLVRRPTRSFGSIS